MPVCCAPQLWLLCCIAASLAHIPLLAGGASSYGTLLLPPSTASPASGTTSTSVTPATAGSLLSSGVFGASSKDFSLSRSGIPVPAKLVSKIQALKFVDMRELLSDNIRLMDRLDNLPASTLQAAGNRQREVPNIQSWVCAFCTYIAIVAEAHPGRVRDLLAYMQNLVRDATRYGGDGWRTYDYIFRSQAAADLSRSWAVPDTALVLAYMVRPGSAPGPPACSHCFDDDHSSQSCALAPFSTPVPTCLPVTAPPPSSAPKPQQKPTSQNICISWNQGACAMPGTCRYRHVCASCPHVGGWGEKHMAKDCPLTSDVSPYKRPPKRFKGIPKQH